MDKLNDIKDLFYINDIPSKIKLVNKILAVIEDESLCQQLKKLALDFNLDIRADLKLKIHDRFNLFGPSRAVEAYTNEQLIFALGQKSLKNRVFILNQLMGILVELHESKNPLLKMTTAKELLKLIESTLGTHFIKIVDSGCRNLYFVPFENKSLNAMFNLDTRSFVFYKTKKEAKSPEYVFVHEFGHAVHTIIFKDGKDVPKSFYDFNINEGYDFNAISAEDKLEFYADFFSVAAMLNTPYENLNPLIDLDREFSGRIKEYFSQELKKSF